MRTTEDAAALNFHIRTVHRDLAKAAVGALDASKRRAAEEERAYLGKAWVPPSLREGDGKLVVGGGGGDGADADMTLIESIQSTKMSKLYACKYDVRSASDVKAERDMENASSGQDTLDLLSALGPQAGKHLLT